MIQSFSTATSKASIAVAFITVALTLAVGSSVHGDEFDRIDNLAQKIQKKSKLLIKEVVHYRHTAQYSSLVSATTHLHDAAGHVHQVAHFANNLNHLQSDLADLDRHLHQLEGLFAATEDAASRGNGHVHGNTGYAKRLLRSIEVSIDLMRKDVRKIQSRSIPQHHQAYRTPTPVAYAAPHYGHDHRDTYHRQAKKVQPRVAQYQSVHPQAGKYQQPAYRQPAYPSQHRQGSGFSFSIGGGNSRIHFNF